MKIRMEHVFNIPIDKFDDLWNDPEVIKAVVAKLPNVKKREIIEQEKRGDHVYRKVLYEGEAEIPDVVKGAVKPDMLKWHEITKYYPDRKEYEFEMIPVFMGDKVRFQGKIKLIPEGNKTRRIIEGELTLKFNLLVRKVIESYIKKYMEDNLDHESKALAAEMEKRYKA
ncbi:MAG: DUF2505 domain-containing protein [Candidatus Calescibacterium sp.]|nr:DUF2505 domain-containing protein [Candidatus Calescibacterium sp.]MDW8088073.1 DUF2505 family protein [Candidatus Calescibacterium sp.]